MDTVFTIMSLRVRSQKSLGAVKSESDSPDDYMQYLKEDEAVVKYCVPTDPSMDSTRGSKGDRRSTFYCDLCQLNLNGYEARESHINGIKHKKKVRQRNGAVCQEDGGESVFNAGQGNVPHDGVSLAPDFSMIRQLPSAPKKVPTRLVEKLRETTEPIVGLAFISETIPCSCGDLEPYYECHLCGSHGGPNCMFSHVLGRPHREKFLRHLHPLDPKYLDLNRSDMMQEVHKKRENENGLDLIDCVFSDELFPWPSGKAPWSQEMGGTGIAPSTIVEAKARRRKRILGVVKSASSYSSVTSLTVPWTKTQVFEAFDFMTEVLTKIKKLHEAGHRLSEDPRDFSTLLHMMDTNVEAMKNMARTKEAAVCTEAESSGHQAINERTPDLITSRAGVGTPQSDWGRRENIRPVTRERSRSPTWPSRDTRSSNVRRSSLNTNRYDTPKLTYF